jgi:GMP reductase
MKKYKDCPKRTEREFNFPHSPQKWKGIPIIQTFKDDIPENNIICFSKLRDLNSFKTGKKINPNYFMISTDIDESQFSSLYDIVRYTNAKWINVVIDTSITKHVVTYCEKLRISFPDKIIVVGNVTTVTMAEELIINGKVDCIKVDCVETELNAIIDCVHRLKGYIITDMDVDFVMW